MATQIKHRRGNSAEIAAFIPALAELIVNTDDNSVIVGDGVTPGGGIILSDQYYEFETVAEMKASLIKFRVGKKIRTSGYYSDNDGGGAEYTVFSTEAVDGFGDHSLADGKVVKLQIDGVINVFQYGVNQSQTKTVNNDAFAAALARSDFDVVRVPFVDSPLNVIGNLSITNGKRIKFDSEYMGEPLLADPDRGLIGDGTAPVFTTGEYPALANTNRQLRIDNARVRNSNFPCLELLHSDDMILDHCAMYTSEANAVKGRFSARVLIRGGHYATTFAVKELETNFCITMYDNCNGLEITPTTVISGGANGSGVDVTQSQKVKVDGIYEVNGGYGQRVGGFNGDPNNLWTPSTVYKKGDEVKNTTNGWVALVDHTSGATFVGDVANWKVINGNCNGVSFGGYMEQVQRPFSIGKANLVLGARQTETYVGNTALPANGVPVPDFCIELGLVIGLGYVGGVSYHKEGTEPTFAFEQPTTGGSFTDRLIDSTLEGHHVQGGGPDLLNNQSTPDQLGLIFGLNRIKLTSGVATSGDRQVFISDKIRGNVGTGNNSFIFDTGNGGVIDSVEVIEKNGTITSTLRVGYTADTADNLNVDPETLSFNANNAASATLSSSLIRINDTQIIRVVAGAGAGTFRVKIIYRM